MRKAFAPFAAIAALALTLTACSSGDAGAQPGPNVELVRVTGEFGSTPTVSFPTPLVTKQTECLEIVEGDGEPLEEGQFLRFDVAFYDGATGELIQATSWNGEDQSRMATDGLFPGLSEALLCGTEGSRVVAVLPPEALFEEGAEVTQTESVVVVADIDRAYLTRANGAPRPGRDGFPAVVLGPDGRPGVTMPGGPAPQSVETAILRQGNGETIQTGDTVTLHFTGLVWETNEVFNSTWANGSPMAFVISGQGTAEVDPLSKALSGALEGQQLGSQVMVVVPPEFAYGDQAQGSIPAGSTLVLVVDILGVDGAR